MSVTTKKKRTLIVLLAVAVVVVMLFLAASSAAVVALVRSVLKPSTLLPPPEQTFSSVEELQESVKDWYDVLYPANLEEGLAFELAAFQPQMRDASLVFACGESHLYIIYELGYNSYSLPPGYAGSQPPIPPTEHTIKVRGIWGSYTAVGGYQTLSWFEQDALRVQILTQPGCDLDRQQLMAIADSLE